MAAILCLFFAFPFNIFRLINLSFGNKFEKFEKFLLTFLLTEPPQIMQKKDATVALGDNAILGCLVVGLPLSDITWTFKGDLVGGDRFSSSSKNGTLVIETVTSEDEGEYQCLAENKMGSSHAMVMLTVQGRFVARVSQQQE